MAGNRFLIVDVFAESQWTGNQLAVVLDAGDLDTLEMQSIAHEFNFSETTFVLADEAGPRGWPVRIFTPQHELPFAGHPTLGTAWVIRSVLLGGRAKRIELDLPVGTIPVVPTVDGDAGVLWMRQVPPRFGARVPPAAVAAALGLEPEDVDENLPAEEVSTGIGFLIAPLTSLDALRRAQVDPTACAALLEGDMTEDVMIVAREGRDPSHQISVRVFAASHGVLEDPATGSANGCLAGWLSRHEVLGDPHVDVTVGQGHEIGRPSLLRLRAWPDGDAIAVEVGGRVIPVAEGRFV
jgi:trans-2,3-dihydro-3-hydroxyanthranilate isomerase